MKCESVRALFAVVLGIGLGACEQLDDSGDSFADEGDPSDVGFRGLTTYNGLELGNGLKFSNGLALGNGLALSNGLAYSNGLAISNGLAYSNGLAPTTGFMASSAGRQLIKYLVECALPTGDTLVKNGYTFAGKIGLAPEWKYGQCSTYCQEWVSACLLARVNEFGLTVKIDMRAQPSEIGTYPGDPSFTEQEGGFFGNLFANPPRAYACRGTNTSNAVLSKRTCTTGTCAMKEVDYSLCSIGCNYSQGGTLSSCQPTKTSSAYTVSVITTYLKKI